MIGKSWGEKQVVMTSVKYRYAKIRPFSSMHCGTRTTCKLNLWWNVASRDL